MIADIADFISSLGISTNVYANKLDGKATKAIGCYHSKRTAPFYIPIGGIDNARYKLLKTTFLIHWSKSPGETEGKAFALADALVNARNQQINNETILFIVPSNPVPIGTDDEGIYEWVIDADIYLQKNKEV